MRSACFHANLLSGSTSSRHLFKPRLDRTRKLQRPFQASLEPETSVPGCQSNWMSAPVGFIRPTPLHRDRRTIHACVDAMPCVVERDVWYIFAKRGTLCRTCRGCVHRSPCSAADIAPVCGGWSCRRCCVGLCPDVWSELMELEGSGRWSDARMVRPFLHQRFKSTRARFRRFLRQRRPLATCSTPVHYACTEYVHILLLSSSFLMLLHPFDHASPPLPRTWSLGSTPPPSSSPPHWFVRPRDPASPPILPRDSHPPSIGHVTGAIPPDVSPHPTVWHRGREDHDIARLWIFPKVSRSPPRRFR